jgi:hypothetical protein
MKKTAGVNAQKSAYIQYRNIDPKSYGILKKQNIILRNEGAKLTMETLVELAHEGARLIPSPDF